MWLDTPGRKPLAMANGASAPVVPDQGRLLQPQGVNELEQITP